MKALILSCNMGQGHNSAGKAVHEELARRGVIVEFMDTLQFAGERVSRQVSGAYTRITTRAPFVFRAIYRIGSLVSSPKRKSPVYYANGLYRDKVYDYIRQNGFDTIIMPHLFPAQVVTALRAERRLDARFVNIATDYTCVPFWEETTPDDFIIPHPALAGEFARKGVPTRVLRPLGIPVSRAFKVREERRAARARLGLPADGQIILIMSGSMGFGHLLELVKRLVERFDGRASVVALTGHNERLREAVSKAYGARQDVFAVPFTDRVSLYMDASDLLFTKPGGLTSTEAAVKNIPTILTPPIPGCETINARFFEARGMALVAGDVADQVRLAEKLLTDDRAARAMQDAQRREINAHAARDICDLLCTGTCAARSLPADVLTNLNVNL